ncbi:MAG: trypsin-like serine protease [Bdellovibrionaceae bacterium]|nr:trypsin-like serine protease [Pseudobdellovibrionaceae bacterium]
MKSSIFISFVFFVLKSFALVNGVKLNDASDVVRISLTNGWICTGVFIDQYTILTAAHCVSPSKNTEILRIDRIETEDNAFISVRANKFIPHPNYSGQYWPIYDIGIIKTSKYENFTGHFKLQEQKEGFVRDSVLVGCGRIEYDKKIYFRTTGENRFLQLGAVLFFIGESRSQTPTTGRKVSVAPNDSGGPILDKISGKIVGIMTTTTLKDSLNYGLPTISAGTSTVVEHNLNFIRNNMGQSSP